MINKTKKLARLAIILLEDKAVITNVDVSSAIVELAPIVGLDTFGDEAVQARATVIAKMVV